MPDLIEIVDQFDPSFYDREGKRGPIVLHAQRHPGVSGQVAPFDGVDASIEHQVPPVDLVPDRSSMGSSVGASRRQDSRAGAAGGAAGCRMSAAARQFRSIPGAALPPTAKLVY